MLVTKNIIERIRPEEAHQLIVVGLLIPERTFGCDFCALPDDCDYRRPSCTALGRKSRNFSGCLCGACHGWRFTRIPWRSLCD